MAAAASASTSAAAARSVARNCPASTSSVRSLIRRSLSRIARRAGVGYSASAPGVPGDPLARRRVLVGVAGEPLPGVARASRALRRDTSASAALSCSRRRPSASAPCVCNVPRLM
eukprot:211605-Prorocentrum_minimum.AAC.1